MTELDYYNGNEHHSGFRISASAISRFFTSTSGWFRETMLGEEGFTGSTASVLGTVVHYCLEQHVNNKPINDNEIHKYLVEQSTKVNDLDVDYINYQYPIMTSVAIDYLDQLNLSTAVAERFIHKELLPEIHVGGSIDLHTDSTVYDYKTTSSKTLPTSIQYGHKLQLLTYAKLLIDEGVPVRYLSILYITTDDSNRVSEKTGKPLKQYPSQVVELTEAITPEDLEMISNIHQVIAESVQLFRDNSRLRHVLAQDLRLKGCSCIYKTPDTEEI